ncbi:hypothetical protein ACC764_08570 [Rhizobium ruizarguesonis]|uniref:hypothetical protein n=1 Tax=Rhizobium ruizarguesonis TaxID=2081791 RepID=UPI00102F6A26|nr:hypothetical protein [Rhizobium ruizarguesonis]TBC98786.1 hypothetical protein ELH25_08835 [Rhizobium ruizarguesonis]TBD15621.1 hypothetical protein ELH24_08790 [Rhizobium ruizarguesonis]TBE96652.1 hypothetical protein ELG98_08645 [Rhizobium ruizarguesonis]
MTDMTSNHVEPISLSLLDVAEEPFGVLVAKAMEEFDVSFGPGNLWRYVATYAETGARRDVVLGGPEGDDGWTLTINRYRGEGTQFICDDAEWNFGMRIGEGQHLSYERAVRLAVRWLSTGLFDELVPEKAA